jgi:tetratricopeptide (TPR) repeat protein
MTRRFSTFACARWFSVAIVCCAPVFSVALGAEPAGLDDTTKVKLVRDRDEARRVAFEAKDAGAYDKAAESLGQVIALDRQLGLDLSDDFTRALAEIAGVHEARQDFAAAEKAWREVLEVQTRLHGAEHWQVGDARRAVALYLQALSIHKQTLREQHPAEGTDPGVPHSDRAEPQSPALPTLRWANRNPLAPKAKHRSQLPNESRDPKIDSQTTAKNRTFSTVPTHS